MLKFIQFTVRGNPVAQQRHRDRSRKNPKAGKYDPSADEKARFLLAAQEYAPSKPLECALRVDVTWYFARPKSHFKTGKRSNELRDDAPIFYTIKKNDRDNLDKFVLDALTGIFWVDDGQAAVGFIQKMYDAVPRIEVTIMELENIVKKET